MHTIADFFVSTWLWGMTFDLSHVILNCLLIFLLLRFLWTKGLLKAALCALFLSGSAFIIHTVVALHVSANIFILKYPVAEQPSQVTAEHALFMCMILAALYAIIQTVLIFAWRLLRRFRVLPYIIIIWISNGFAATLSYVGMRIFMWYSF
jgi:hypothetical protein